MDRYMTKQWITLFSQSGSEIVRLKNHIGKWPDVIITNNSDVDSWCNEMRDLFLRGKARGEGKSRVKIVTPQQAQTCNVLHKYARPDALITLHGWLRIIPKDICEYYDIYNGHPGLINVHPELKGKDPQQRAYDLGHAAIGSVVHKVTPIVDDGEILEYAATFSHELDNLDGVYSKLQHTSFEAWKKFFDKL